MATRIVARGHALETGPDTHDDDRDRLIEGAAMASDPHLLEHVARELGLRSADTGGGVDDERA